MLKPDTSNSNDSSRSSLASAASMPPDPEFIRAVPVREVMRSVGAILSSSDGDNDTRGTASSRRRAG